MKSKKIALEKEKGDIVWATLTTIFTAYITISTTINENIFLISYPVIMYTIPIFRNVDYFLKIYGHYENEDDYIYKYLKLYGDTPENQRLAKERYFPHDNMLRKLKKCYTFAFYFSLIVLFAWFNMNSIFTESVQLFLYIFFYSLTLLLHLVEKIYTNRMSKIY